MLRCLWCSIRVELAEVFCAALVIAFCRLLFVVLRLSYVVFVVLFALRLLRCGFFVTQIVL